MSAQPELDRSRPPAPRYNVRPVPVLEPGAVYAPVIKLNPPPRPDRGTPAGGGQVVPLRRTEEHREACLLARKMALAAVEVLAGVRQPQQLARWMDARSYEALRLRAALTAQRPASAAGALHRNPAIRSVHACAVRPGAYELSLVVAEERRVRAVAMRLEQDGGAWKVAALEIG
ncbi:Rv3235 family protein [Paenarthrobacter sp. DKR-5]|uniref:Rv3235 family protein n=1 Tax=Paenarthrobacter sp. DKR-5 TaxID=2835535 RepID=UPI002028B376|nr:Rv3235 family protein [Paenarthrobacter sp. DKR-5]